MYKAGVTKDVTYCDSPGFGDTASIEVDMANNVGLINALKGAKSLKIVIIVPYGAFDGNLDGLRNLIKTVSNMFNNLGDISECITFLFNKFPKDQIKHAANFIESKM
jgi:hypothetical protein